MYRNSAIYSINLSTLSLSLLYLVRTLINYSNEIVLHF